LSDIVSKKKPLTIVDKGGYKNIKSDDIINTHIEFNKLSNTPQKITFSHGKEGIAFQKLYKKIISRTNEHNKDIRDVLIILLCSNALIEKKKYFYN
tara:strand:+ start:275 stop:562 length:288 start_codon:yes stop_codon:yes gene_type:complete